MEYNIKTLIKENEKKATEIIEDGLKEYFEMYDSSYNPDLENLYDYYINSGNVFLVGIENGNIISTGGLIEENSKTGRIVRMSVKKEYRRNGFASKMLKVLENFGKSRGYSKIVLETTEKWDKVVEFYLKNEYNKVSADLVNVYFEKIL